MNAIGQLYRGLFFIGLFFIPFNSYKGLSFLGEFSKESAFIFFAIGLLVFLLAVLMKGKLYLPLNNSSYGVVFFFFLWCLICTLFNGWEVYGNYFKQTSGFNRFIRQYFVLIISGLFLFIYFYNVFKHYGITELFLKIRRIFMYSFILVCTYAIFEILVVVLNQQAFLPILNLFNYLPFTEVRLDRTFNRISSLTWEPPYLAIYLITISGWMFSYILTGKSLVKYLPALGIIVLVFFSGSRTALVVVLLQLFTFLILALEIKRFQKYFVYFLSLVIVGFLAITVITKGEVITTAGEKIETLNFKDNLTKSISNKSRFGIQYANLKVFADRPLFGVGFGQQAYFARKYYPSWATEDNYEFEYTFLNERIRSFPPGFNMYIRLLAETGIIGFLIFMTFLTLIYLNLRRLLKNSNKDRIVFMVILMVSFVGFAINWLQVDTFRLFGFWIFLALFVRVSSAVKSQTIPEDNV